jgi:predicted metal-dependent hydrolase
MKTKWGACSPEHGTIRLNTELYKKPPLLMEYVVAHELLHLKEPRHSARFKELLTKAYPN